MRSASRPQSNWRWPTGFEALGNALKPALTAVSRRRLPQVNGRIYSPSLRAPVTIRRDAWGIPHIHARDRHDLYAAQGFVHAQDRLWQMELNRRAAAGELSVIFGRITLDTDRLSRTLGFARLAEESWRSLETQTREDLAAYTAGVNEFLENRPALPVEFSLLRHRPRPWRVQDSLAYGRLQMWALTNGAMGELVNARLRKHLDPVAAAQLGIQYPESQPVTLPDGIEWNVFGEDRLLTLAHDPFMGKGKLDGAGRGSNAWVIAGCRSTTGRPILCNDMHLPVSAPSLWYYLHLMSDDGLHMAGFSQPGLPYALVGHNDHIAWGATLAYTDCEDLFLEEVHPDDAGLYRFQDGWRQAKVVNEQIAVRGGRDFDQVVAITHHGPIVSGLLADDQQAVALSSVALKAEATFDGFRLLGEAGSWETFVSAVSRIEAPSLNILYADTAGNIGHYVSGRIPVRAGGDGTLPAPGWTGEAEWLGEVPFVEMPHALNPEKGYIISANNRIAGDAYPHFLGRVWRSGYRAQRIDQLILGQEQISPEDCLRFQLDVLSLPGLEIVEQLSDHRPASETARLPWALLQDWDGRLTSNSVGGAVYKVFSSKLAGKILGSLLPDDLQQQYLGLGPHPILVPVNEFQGHWPATLIRMLREQWPEWLPDKWRMIEISLEGTADELRMLMGEEPAGWQWGKLHRMSITHALGLQEPFDRIFSQGPFPMGGDVDTVAQCSIRPGAHYDNIAIAVSSRQVIDLGDLENSRAMYAPGQSGHLGSSHYDDMILPWVEGDYFPMLWESESVRKNAQHELIMLPTQSAAGSSHGE